MVSGISGSSSLSRIGSMPPKPPSPEERFKMDDTNGDGGIDKTELDAVVSKIQEKTGQTIDTESMISEYDEDGDGKLNQSEMENAMKPLMEEGRQRMMANPPEGQMPSFLEAIESDDEESTQDSQLAALLEQYNANSGTSAASSLLDMDL